MANRLDLQTKFEVILGSRNVYFQPPSSVKMKYPAIVYKLDDIRNIHAENEVYISKLRYLVTYITDDPDSKLITDISKIPYCRFNRYYTSDNLNHYTYELYF